MLYALTCRLTAAGDVPHGSAWPPKCCESSCMRLSCAQVGAASTKSGSEAEAEAQIEQLYGDLLGGPKQAQRTAQERARAAGLAVASPEGTAALSEGIAGLLKGHVEWQHQAHHRLLPVRACTAATPTPIQQYRTHAAHAAAHAGVARLHADAVVICMLAQLRCTSSVLQHAQSCKWWLSLTRRWSAFSEWQSWGAPARRRRRSCASWRRSWARCRRRRRPWRRAWTAQSSCTPTCRAGAHAQQHLHLPGSLPMPSAV